MPPIDYPPVQQALERLRGLSADAEIQRLAFVRERALRDERNELFGAREEGIIQGEVTILTRLLRRRFGPVSEATRTRLQTATPEQLEAWAERLLIKNTPGFSPEESEALLGRMDIERTACAAWLPKGARAAWIPRKSSSAMPPRTSSAK